MLQVNRYVLRLLAVTIVFGSISSYLNVALSYSIPLNFSSLIASADNSAEAFLKSGSAKYRNKDYKGAIADYTEVIRINLNYAYAYVSRGITKNRLEDQYGLLSTTLKLYVSTLKMLKYISSVPE